MTVYFYAATNKVSRNDGPQPGAVKKKRGTRQKDIFVAHINVFSNNTIVEDTRHYCLFEIVLPCVAPESARMPPPPLFFFRTLNEEDT